MNNKTKGIYFAVLAVLYLGYTVLIAGHGIHLTNTAGFIFIIGLAGYFFLKDKNNNQK